jgi:hypothetical protein
VFAIFTPVLTLRNWTFRKEHKWNLNYADNGVLHL